MKTKRSSHQTTRGQGQKQSALALAPIGKQECFKEAKTIKTVTKFIIGNTAQCMVEHTGKQSVYPTQKHGRYTHPERKGMGILSNEERSTVNQKLGRDSCLERSVGILSEDQCSTEVM